MSKTRFYAILYFEVLTTAIVLAVIMQEWLARL